MDSKKYGSITLKKTIIEAKADEHLREASKSGFFA